MSGGNPRCPRCIDMTRLAINFISKHNLLSFLVNLMFQHKRRPSSVNLWNLQWYCQQTQIYNLLFQHFRTVGKRTESNHYFAKAVVVPHHHGKPLPSGSFHFTGIFREIEVFNDDSFLLNKSDHKWMEKERLLNGNKCRYRNEWRKGNGFTNNAFAQVLKQLMSSQVVEREKVCLDWKITKVAERTKETNSKVNHHQIEL